MIGTTRAKRISKKTKTESVLDSALWSLANNSYSTIIIVVVLVVTMSFGAFVSWAI